MNRVAITRGKQRRAKWARGSTVVKSESEVAQSSLTLCDPVDCSLPGSSVHGILQARILEWVAISFSRGSSRPRDWTRSPALEADTLTSEPPEKPCMVKDENKIFGGEAYCSVYRSQSIMLYTWKLHNVISNTQPLVATGYPIGQDRNRTFHLHRGFYWITLISNENTCKA